jgi:PAS domain S-box-containing protein
MIEIFPNETGAKFLEDDLRVLKSGYEKIEETILLLDGKLHDFETQKFIIPRQGQEPFLGGISIDITEHKQTEKELKVREEKYRNLFNRANEGLILLTMDGKIAELNESFAQMHGYTIDEMKNMDIKDLDVLGDKAFEGRDEVMQRLLSGEVVRFEVEHYHKDGHSFHLNDTVSIITIDDKQYFLAFHQDITERKQAEKELKVREERYRNLFDRANEGLILLTMDGKIAELNQSFAQMHGYTIDEMKNMDIKDLDVLGENAFERRYDEMKRLLAGEVVRFEVEHYHKNGYSFHLSDTVNLITIDDQHYFLAFHQDITDRKQAEKELKESREQLRNYASHLQHVSEKERLSITLEIHDSLAQYLVALKIAMGIYLKKLSVGSKTVSKDKVMAKIDEFINQTDKTIKSARSIMNGLRPDQLELLGFAEATEVYLQEFEVSHHIECTFTNVIKDRKIQPEQALSLFRILQESLNNILKHAMATLVSVQLSNIDNMLILEISDNGVGFDKENSGRPDSFGLIGMNELARILNGSFEISTKEGEGTKVKVKIPDLG